MKVLTAAAMREADRRVSAELGLPGAVLMENAGLRVTEAVAAINTQRQKVVIVAGPGNNGGDGVVAARLLSQAGFTVSLWSTSRPGQNPGDADNNLKFLSNSGVDWLHILETGELPAFRADLKKAGLVIDALLGTGVSRPVEGLFAAIIQAINEQEAPVLAVDIPSGVGADSGQVMGTAVKARWTVTLAYPKQGLFLYPGAELAGEISIGSIHIPPFLVESAPTGLITAGQVRQWLLPRPQNAHKGSFGRVLLWAGSIGMTGAATLAGKAALRGGAGLV
ncbi:MAG: NAD(P)H-hydrate epimerase, partial [Firmicutes bacterium]|nr:NAD(P)H-hydrate epimerase [Bacillota bacterium]